MITPIILGSILGITGGTITGHSIEFNKGKIVIDFKKGIEEANKNGFVNGMLCFGIVAFGCAVEEVRSEIIEEYKNDFKEQIQCDLYAVRDDLVTRETEEAYNIQDKIANSDIKELEKAINDMKKENDKYTKLEYFGLASLYGDKDYTYNVIASDCDDILDRTMNEIDNYLDNIWSIEEASKLPNCSLGDFNDELADLTKTYEF